MISLKSVVLPTPLRPTSPARSAPKLRSRLKKAAARQAWTTRDWKVWMAQTWVSRMARQSGICDRVEIHGAPSLLVLRMVVI